MRSVSARRALLAVAIGLLATTSFAAASAVSPDRQAAQKPWTAKQRDAVATTLTESMKELAKREDLPSIAVGVFDRNGLIWSGAVGHRDAKGAEAATDRTPYYAGSISKLFTDIVAMQMVEEGKLDLDAPIKKYLPDFAPHNPFCGEITLRLLMTHRSGLVREPPEGSYYDLSSHALADVVRSLNQTTLVAAPGTLTKYSNAAIAVVGRVIEAVEGVPYAQVMRVRILDRLGMTESAFPDDSGAHPAPAFAVIPGYDTKRVPAPALGKIGLDPAGGLITNVIDLAKFGRAILNRGEGDHGRIMSAGGYSEMTRQQFGEEDETHGYGLGFAIHKEGDVVAIGHGGAIYGYVADLKVLPDEGIGVVAFAAADLSAAPMTLADLAIASLQAAAHGKQQPNLPPDSVPLTETERLTLQGYYLDDDDSVYVRTLGGEAYIETPRYVGRLRRQGQTIAFETGLVAPKAFEIDPAGKWVRIDRRTFRREAPPMPPPPPDSFADLIGEYGPDNSVFRVYERDGKPQFLAEALISSIKPKSKDRWAFGDDDWLYQKESIQFVRDKKGAATAISLNGIILERRPVAPPFGKVTRAQRRQLEDALKAAKAATPPVEPPKPAKSDLVEISSIEPSIRIDLRYASDRNFLGAPFYERGARALGQRKAVEALARAHRALAASGYGVVVFDAYRPWYVTKLFWDATPPENHEFVANPADGSRHNRGAAFDISMYDLKTGEIVEMPAHYDETSERSYANYMGGTSAQRWRRELLRMAMEHEGFDIYPFEWWHYDLRGWQDYPIGNQEPRLEKR